MTFDRSFQLTTRTIAVVDLVGYSSLARTLQLAGSAIGVAELNRKIRSLVESALRATGGEPDGNILQWTGDGAILVFPSPTAAVEFTIDFQACVRASHAADGQDAPPMWFRAGIATGQLSAQDVDGRTLYEGISIADAVRLESACGAGEVLVDLPTWNELPDPPRGHFEPEEQVAGKRDERFRARRLRDGGPPVQTRLAGSVQPLAKGVRSTLKDRQQNYWLIGRIEDDGDLDKLMYLIGMPLAKRPSAMATVNSRQATILNWAASSQGCGDEDLRLNLELILKMREVCVQSA